MARTSKKAAAAKPARAPKRAKGTKAAAKTPKKTAKKAAKAPAKKAVAKKPAPKPVKAPVSKATAAKSATKNAKPKPAKPKAEAPPKAPAKQAPPPKPEPAPAPPRKPRKPEVTPKAIEKIKVGLEEQRVALLREFDELEEGAFSLSQSDMSGEASFDEEYADAGSYTFEREKELSIGNNIRDLLDKVSHALDRIERGSYGLCENCGDPINKDRLLALPYSSLCIRCKQAEERAR